MVTDSLRPYVDHDFPFDGVGVVRERVENMLELQLDNSDALEPKPHGWPRSPEERMGEGPPSVRRPSLCEVRKARQRAGCTRRRSSRDRCSTRCGGGKRSRKRSALANFDAAQTSLPRGVSCNNA